MKIIMARGDIYCIPFAIYIDDVKSASEMDNVYFTVKKNYYDETPLLQKSLGDGTINSDGQGNYVITINPEDTDSLDFGTYDYDIEVVRLPDIKQTFADELELTKEVTHHSNEEE